MLNLSRSVAYPKDMAGTDMKYKRNEVEGIQDIKKGNLLTVCMCLVVN